MQVRVRLSGRETSRLFLSGDTLIQLPLDGALPDADGSPVPRTGIFLSELAGTAGRALRGSSPTRRPRGLRRRRAQPTRDRLGGIVTDQADILAAQLAPTGRRPASSRRCSSHATGSWSPPTPTRLRRRRRGRPGGGLIDLGARLAAELRPARGEVHLARVRRAQRRPGTLRRRAHARARRYAQRPHLRVPSQRRRHRDRPAGAAGRTDGRGLSWKMRSNNWTCWRGASASAPAARSSSPVVSAPSPAAATRTAR